MEYTSFRFERRINGHNHFASITIGMSFNVLNKHPSKISITIPKNSNFKEAICSAAEYFLDHYQYGNNVFIEVDSGNVGWLPLETTSTMVFYVMVKALCECSKFSIDGFHLDTESEILSLPLPKAGVDKPNVLVIID